MPSRDRAGLSMVSEVRVLKKKVLLSRRIRGLLGHLVSGFLIL